LVIFVDTSKLSAGLLLRMALLALLTTLFVTFALRPPDIQITYGEAQQFGASAGRRADPQGRINILGRVTSTAPIVSLSYTLNGGPPQPLRIGPDNRRLGAPGDFNVDIGLPKLLPGRNDIVITAVDGFGGSAQRQLAVEHPGGVADWQPGSYLFDWGTAERVENLAQIVDGHWIIDGDTVRPTTFDYDRLLAVGDVSWRDYTVTVPITYFDIDLEGYLPPSDGPGVGVLVRWRGHFDNDLSRGPVDGWSHFGALGWYRWRRDIGPSATGIQLLSHGGREIGSNFRRLEAGTTYVFKIMVESSPDPAAPATYKFKVWPAAEPEPEAWDFEARGHQNEPDSGSLLLVAHHVNARFGPVHVELAAVQPADLTGDSVGQ
jgi:hypothetical protein